MHGSSSSSAHGLGQALAKLKSGRTIKVAISQRSFSTEHSCVIAGGQFCGQHGICSYYSIGEPSRRGMCMSDGYFWTSSEPEDKTFRIAFLSLQLVCQESRDAVLGSHRYSRLLRCNPAADLLLIKAASLRSSLHMHPEQPTTPVEIRQQKMLDQGFPQDVNLFWYFRELVSSFHHVGILCGYELDNDESYEVTDGAEYTMLLGCFVSLKRLYLWANPKNRYHRLPKGRMKVGNIRDPRPDYKHFGDIAEGVLYEYNKDAAIQNNHFADHDEHWVPRPKRLETIGFYAEPY
ncbi:hypothetical protein TruAng_000971 [Truncatella angustata]|nr:hypothetical protein TruAng_000971 [Truncatella angustata]